MKNKLCVGDLARNVTCGEAVRAPDGASLQGVAAGCADPERGSAVMHVPKRNARQEYRLKQREWIDASPLIAKKFPGLKALKVTLGFVEAAGPTKNGELKCTLNLEHAKSALWFACPGMECLEGGFDLSAALAMAVAEGRKSATGQLGCPGTRKRGDHAKVPCQTLLRYKLDLNYE